MMFSKSVRNVATIAALSSASFSCGRDEVAEAGAAEHGLVQAESRRESDVEGRVNNAVEALLRERGRLAETVPSPLVIDSKDPGVSELESDQRYHTRKSALAELELAVQEQGRPYREDLLDPVLTLIDLSIDEGLERSRRISKRNDARSSSSSGEPDHTAVTQEAAFELALYVELQECFSTLHRRIQQDAEAVSRGEILDESRQIRRSFAELEAQTVRLQAGPRVGGAFDRSPAFGIESRSQRKLRFLPPYQTLLAERLHKAWEEASQTPPSGSTPEEQREQHHSRDIANQLIRILGRL
ncbi:hypothetical protein MRY87_11900 [bacterium]|nr:hypothetical protein [bacterium]